MAMFPVLAFFAEDTSIDHIHTFHTHISDQYKSSLAYTFLLDATTALLYTSTEELRDELLRVQNVYVPSHTHTHAYSPSHTPSHRDIHCIVHSLQEYDIHIVDIHIHTHTNIRIQDILRTYVHNIHIHSVGEGRVCVW
ncbi:hypothetical protein EON63_12470, partial [archaeon]